MPRPSDERPALLASFASTVQPSASIPLDSLGLVEPLYFARVQDRPALGSSRNSHGLPACWLEP